MKRNRIFLKNVLQFENAFKRKALYAKPYKSPFDKDYGIRIFIIKYKFSNNEEYSQSIDRIYCLQYHLIERLIIFLQVSSMPTRMEKVEEILPI